MQSDSIHVEEAAPPRPVRARSFLDGTNVEADANTDPTKQGATEKDIHANRYDFYDVNRGVSSNPFEEYREDSQYVVNPLATKEEEERKKTFGNRYEFQRRIGESDGPRNPNDYKESAEGQREMW